MIKFIKDIIGSDVMLFQERAKAGVARGVIIDANDGSFLGITLAEPGSKKEKVIPASEIKGTGKSLILVKEYSSISDPEDIVRIKAALEINPKIIGASVETESHQYLGKVNNATINFKILSLEQLYVTSSSLVSFLARDLIIPAKKIIEIQKNKIIVSDEFATARAPKVTPATIFAPE